MMFLLTALFPPLTLISDDQLTLILVLVIATVQYSHSLKISEQAEKLRKHSSSVSSPISHSLLYAPPPPPFRWFLTAVLCTVYIYRHYDSWRCVTPTAGGPMEFFLTSYFFPNTSVDFYCTRQHEELRPFFASTKKTKIYQKLPVASTMQRTNL